eukprot:GGOE01020491.1.p2 GENE.GGOE01020491.1~~GGOE01020491.1.p2  ORF type:complete len:157 (+),score=1.33 GGOE01020491.1:822-1292(+)
MNPFAPFSLTPHSAGSLPSQALCAQWGLPSLRQHPTANRTVSAPHFAVPLFLSGGASPTAPPRVVEKHVDDRPLRGPILGRPLSPVSAIVSDTPSPPPCPPATPCGTTPSGVPGTGNAPKIPCSVGAMTSARLSMPLPTRHTAKAGTVRDEPFHMA